MTRADVKPFVRGFGVRVISCFAVRLRLTAWQRKNITTPGWHFKAKDSLQSAPTTAIYDVGSHNRNSADKFPIAADHPAVVEHCDDGERSSATSPRSAVSKILGILRSVETLSAPTSPSIVPVCSDGVPIGAAGNVGAMDIHTDNVVTI